MTTRNSTATAEEQKTVELERTFNLPVATVWKAFSDPTAFKLWWGPKEYTCPDCTIDFKEGGKFVASMQGEDGKKIWAVGHYKEIIWLKKIVYLDSFADSQGNVVPASDYTMPGEWPLECLVTIEVEEVDGKTKLRLQHEDLPEEMIDDCRKGWQSSFDKLEENVR